MSTLYSPNGTYIVAEETDEISDGFHTFGELYQHRIALFIVLAHAMVHRSWRSKHHQVGGGEMFEGFFIAGINLPTGAISYHLPLKDWDLLDGVTTLKNAPEWDGHTSDDVVTRLNAWSKARTDEYHQTFVDDMWPEEQKNA